MNKQTLPPATRRAINRKAHQMALAAEAHIRERLTIIALAAVETGPTANDDLCGMRPMGDDQFTEHAVNLEEMFCKDKSA